MTVLSAPIDAAPAGASAARLRGAPAASVQPVATGEGFGKIILLGEHAVVYGAHALVVPVATAVRVHVRAAAAGGGRLRVAAWGVDVPLPATAPTAAVAPRLQQIVAQLCHNVGMQDRALELEILPQVPCGSGLGGSAALAVAVLRALSAHGQLQLDDATIDAHAFAAEHLAHGSPSGVDNTVATYGQFVLFQRGSPASQRRLAPTQPLPLVIAHSGVPGLTLDMVARVRRARALRPRRYDQIFARIDALAQAGAEAVVRGDLLLLGQLMRRNHLLLRALDVSCSQLDAMVALALRHGAVGAKLTGGGGGGAMVALCLGDPGPIVRALTAAGYASRALTVGGGRPTTQVVDLPEFEHRIGH